jgi:hypothetical protein
LKILQADHRRGDGRAMVGSDRHPFHRRRRPEHDPIGLHRIMLSFGLLVAFSAPNRNPLRRKML